jgi:hypothetical protein
MNTVIVAVFVLIRFYLTITSLVEMLASCENVPGVRHSTQALLAQ